MKLLKLCMRPFQVSGTGMNLRDLSWWGFILRINGELKNRTASQQLCTQDLNSAGAVRRGPPHGPSVPQKPGLPSPATPLHSPHPAAVSASLHGTDSSTAPLLPASSLWLADHFPEPISKRSIEIAHSQVPGIVLNTQCTVQKSIFFWHKVQPYGKPNALLSKVLR